MGKKTRKSSFVKQAAILAVAGILVRVLGFLYRVPLTNMIGDEGNGIYSAGYYIYTFFLVMSSAGLPVAISKMVSEKISVGRFSAAHKIFKVSLWVAFTIGLIFSLAMYFGAKQLCNIIGSPDSYYTILTLSPTVCIVSVMAVFRGYFQGMNTTVPTALSQVVEQIFNAIFSVYLAYLFIDNVLYSAAGGTAGTGIGALAGLLFIIFAYFLAHPSIKRRIHHDKLFYKEESAKKITKNLIKLAVPIITGTAIFSMTNLIDMQMVNSRLEAAGFPQNQINALYGQLTGKYVTITTLPVSISTAVATAVLPAIAAGVAKKAYKDVNLKINVALRVTMIISIPAAIGIGVLGNQILEMLYPSYSEGGILLQVGSISIIFLALSQIATGILQGLSKVYVPAANALIGAIVKIPLNYFLISIPEINVVGAVISTIACYAIASFLNFRALTKATKARPDYTGVLLKPIIASIFMAIICHFSYKVFNYFIGINTISTIIAICLGGLTYFITMAFIGGLKKEDLEFMPMGRKISKTLRKYRLL